MDNLKLYFCQITDDRWHENYENIENMYPNVDKIIIIDGRGETTEKGLREKYNNDLIIVDGDVCNDRLNNSDVYFTTQEKLNIKNKKIVLIKFPWRDDFILSRNQYIYAVESLRDKNEDSWFIISDEDEFMSKRLVNRLRNLCEWADKSGLSMLKVASRDIELDEKGSRISEIIGGYHKELIFKYEDGMRISGKLVHHGMHRPYHENTDFINLPMQLEKGKDFEILYEHRKMGMAIIYERAHCRNWFIYASNFADSNKLWKPFRKLIDQCIKEDGFNKIESWHEYRDYLEKGKVNQKLKDWFIRYAMEGIKDRDFSVWPESEAEKHYRIFPHPETGQVCDIGYPGASEAREGFYLYFGYYHRDELLDLSKDIVLKSNLDQEIKDWYMENKK